MKEETKDTIIELVVKKLGEEKEKNKQLLKELEETRYKLREKADASERYLRFLKGLAPTTLSPCRGLLPASRLELLFLY